MYEKDEVKQKNKMRMRLKREEDRKVQSQCKKSCEEYKEKESERKQLCCKKIEASSIENPRTCDLRKACSSPQLLEKLSLKQSSLFQNHLQRNCSHISPTF